MSTATESTHRTHVNLPSLDDEGNGDRRFPRIARPFELLRHTYDVVVIGSGYGGGVAASRMARGGQSVCLLERGKERWPGEFPGGTVECLEELAVSGETEESARPFRVGGPTSLYQLVLGEGQDAFVASGLGGTSLLNANVFLRADAGTMSLPYWPEELRRKGELDEYYDLAQSMLEPESYPEDWPELQKLKVLEKQAHDLGWADKFYRVPQTTRFRHGLNSTGVPMNPSTLTGQDATGLNDGSKSTTLVNYLADAWNWGTEMFCECEARYVTKHPVSGYLVFFAWHGSGRDKFGERRYEDLLWVHARHCVFLGAGSLGTTEILLRSKQYGLDMSNRVGEGMSGNGDILAFGYNCDVPVNAMGREFPSPYHPIGPCITGIIDNRTGHANPLDGFVLEEGAVPKALVPMFQMMCALMPGKIDPNAGYLEKLKKKLASLGSAIRGPYYDKGSVERSQIYLIMSHDANQAILSLKDDKPRLKFLGVSRSEHVEYLNSVLARATAAVGGTFVNNPFTALGQQEVTVHPIGGACISQDGTGLSGATNHFGEVFTGAGIETHKGLVVTDGAAVPTALGVNPFATITALAERSVRKTAERFGWSIDYTPNKGVLNLFGFPKVVIPDDAGMTEAQALIQETRTDKVAGFEFSEVMEGFIHFGSGCSMAGDRLEDFEYAARIARGNCSAARIFASIKSWNTETLVRRPDHSAMLTGTLACAGLPGGPFMIARGSFGLFTENVSISETKNLGYRAIMVGTDGAQYRLNGFKVVNPSVVLNPLQLWRRTTTLYVSISRLDGPVIGRGVLSISLANFAKEARTMRPSGGNSFLTRVRSTVSFLGYFASSAASLFLMPFAPLQYPHQGVTGFINPTPPSQSIRLTASDGVLSYMHVYEPTTTNIPVHDILFIPGASVNQAIYALETIDKNAVNYFTERGYRCWVLVHRIGYNMRPNDQWTTYDARLDIAAALRYIRSAQALDSVYVIAHCMGAVAFSSGLLDRTIPPSWIRGITASQVFCNPIWALVNMAKVLSPLPITTIYKSLAGNWFGSVSSPDNTLVQRTLDQVLRFYPVEREEVCNNIACHRTSFMFGRLWNHANLNSATHTQTHLFLSGVTMALENLLMPMGRRGVVTSNLPLAQDLVSKEAIRRLEGIPIFLFSGEDNRVLRAESTLTSYEILRDANGAVGYEREVVPGYGHLDCWMGTRACVDVYPMVEERVRQVCRAGEEGNLISL